MKWTQHTSNLQEGNAAVCCIPASRRASSAAATRGAKRRTPLRKLLGVWQRSIAADITPPGWKHKSRATQSLSVSYIDRPSNAHVQTSSSPSRWTYCFYYSRKVVAAELSWVELSWAGSEGSTECTSPERLSSAPCVCQWAGLMLLSSDIGQGVSVDIIWSKIIAVHHDLWQKCI